MRVRVGVAVDLALVGQQPGPERRVAQRDLLVGDRPVLDLGVRVELPQRVERALERHQHRGRAGPDLGADLEALGGEAGGELPDAAVDRGARQQRDRAADDAGDVLDPRQLVGLVDVVGDDLHRAVAAVAQGLGDGDHLVGAGVGAGDDLALLVAVAVEARRREPERPVGQRAPAELGHAGDVVGGGVVVAAVAHHVVAQRDVGDLGADVDAVGRVDGVEVLAERLPAPRDALVQGGAGDVLDGLHQRDELGLRCPGGPARSRRRSCPSRPS